MLLIRRLTLAQDRAHPRNIPTQALDQCRILELLRCTAKTQTEKLFLLLGQLLANFVILGYLLGQVYLEPYPRELGLRRYV